MKGGDHMVDDSVAGHTPQRGGRRPRAASSVLTPPIGVPAVRPASPAIPAQRTAPVEPPRPPERPAVVDPCTCGHAREAHEHYRAGADCGVCGADMCAAFRPAERTGVLRRLFRKR